MKQGKLVLTVMGLLLCASTTAMAATDIQITVLDNGTAVAEAEITLYQSADMQTAVTDEHGVANVELEYNGGFWVEVNGKRLAEFFEAGRATVEIDLATVEIMEWQGR